jgi:hypothetical protein
MGFNERYLKIDDISGVAKTVDFASFNLYMTNSDAHIFMDDLANSVHEKYVGLPMHDREIAYKNIRADLITEMLNW